VLKKKGKGTREKIVFPRTPENADGGLRVVLRKKIWASFFFSVPPIVDFWGEGYLRDKTQS
jgi:hypothetical protein